MLVDSPRHHARDLTEWTLREREDELHCRTDAFVRLVERANRVLRDFDDLGGDCYVGVSWGKDSVVVADIVTRACPSIPLVWVRVEPISNPDCLRVRDAFLKDRPRVTYREVVVACESNGAGGWRATGTLERGFAEAVRRFGGRHISGVRGEESGTRKLRMRRWGETSEHTCAPIGWWTGADVFAYLYWRGLPVHPAYAMSQGGIWPRERLRVSSLGGKRGTGMGRRAWEWHYYRDEMRRLGERE